MKSILGAGIPFRNETVELGSIDIHEIEFTADDGIQVFREVIHAIERVRREDHRYHSRETRDEDNDEREVEHRSLVQEREACPPPPARGEP